MNKFKDMVYFLYGEDDFSSSEKLSKIRNDFLEKNAQGSVLSILDFDESVKDELRDVIGSGGLFSASKLVIVRNIFSSTDKSYQERVVEFLKSNEYIFGDNDNIVVFWERGKPKKNTKLFKILDKNAECKQFDILSRVALQKWIIDRVKKLDGKISKEAVNNLAIFVDGDLWQMKNEIEKLTCMMDGKEIDVESVELTVKPKIKSDIFKTIEALAAGDKAGALRLLHNQIESGDDPFYILSMYVYQFRNLLKISNFYFGGLRNHYEVAKIAKLHPFVVQKGMGQLNRLSSAKLKEIYRRLEELDSKVKIGEIDILLALDRFIVEI
ncbi:DNA polymerase III subunit delta [Patescibacteria group bacterium]